MNEREQRPEDEGDGSEHTPTEEDARNALRILLKATGTDVRLGRQFSASAGEAPDASVQSVAARAAERAIKMVRTGQAAAAKTASGEKSSER
jgi:hypothetical protein